MAIIFAFIGILLLAIIGLVLFVWMFPERATALALTVTRKQSKLTRKEIMLPSGMRFVYLEGGVGPPLMLLHGFGGNKDTFVRVASYLVERYRVIVPDIIGFGESAHPNDVDYSAASQASRLHSLVQALNIDQIHLAGNSMGGQIALVYATMYPSEVESLWLLSPSGIWGAPWSDVINRYFTKGENLLIARNELEFNKVMELGMHKPPFIPVPILKVLARERIENVALEEKIASQLLGESIEQKINGLKTPTLVMFGEYDSVISLRTADTLVKLLPNAESVVIKEAGHVSMFDQPARCARAYLAFRMRVLLNPSLLAKEVD